MIIFLASIHFFHLASFIPSNPTGMFGGEKNQDNNVKNKIAKIIPPAIVSI